MSIQVYRTISCLCHQWNVGLSSCVFEKFNTEGLKYAGSSFCVCLRFTKGLNWDFILLLITYALVLPCLSAVWTQASSVLCGCWHWNFFMLYGVLFQVSLRKCTQLIYLHPRALVKYYLWATHNLHSGFCFLSFKKHLHSFLTGLNCLRSCISDVDLKEMLMCSICWTIKVHHLRFISQLLTLHQRDVSFKYGWATGSLKVFTFSFPGFIFSDKSVMRNVVCVYLYVRLVQTMFQ